MSDLNSVNLIGRLTRDIEVRYTQSNIAHSIFSIAVNRNVKDGNGWKEETSFIGVEVWGNLAESIKKYSGKGKRIAVNGYIVQKSYQAKDGSNQNKTYVVANSVTLIDRVQTDQQQAPQQGNYQQQYQQPMQNQQQAQQGNYQQQQGNYQQQQSQNQQQATPYPYEDFDDIPF